MSYGLYGNGAHSRIHGKERDQEFNASLADDRPTEVRLEVKRHGAACAMRIDADLLEPMIRGLEYLVAHRDYEEVGA